MSVCCTYLDKNFPGDILNLAQILSGVPCLVCMFLPQVLLLCKAKSCCLKPFHLFINCLPVWSWHFREFSYKFFVIIFVAAVFGVCIKKSQHTVCRWIWRLYSLSSKQCVNKLVSWWVPFVYSINFYDPAGSDWHLRSFKLMAPYVKERTKFNMSHYSNAECQSVVNWNCFIFWCGGLKFKITLDFLGQFMWHAVVEIFFLLCCAELKLKLSNSFICDSSYIESMIFVSNSLPY